MEKKGILGNTTGRRPGDVTFQRWAEGKALVIDVAVTSPLVDTNVRLEDPCNWNAATQKHGKYDASFKDTQYTFSAMVFETSTMKAISLRSQAPWSRVHFLLPSLGSSDAICNGLFCKLF